VNVYALTVRDLAERERVATATVRTWVAEGEAPPHYRIGRLIRFRLADVELWERERMFDPDGPSRYDDWAFDLDGAAAGAQEAA